MNFSQSSGGSILNNLVTYIIDPLVILLFSVGFLLFIWGLVVFLANAQDTSERKTGIKHMIWGFVGMFIMIAFTGIIGLIDNTFGLNLGRASSGTQQTQDRSSPFFPDGF